MNCIEFNAKQSAEYLKNNDNFLILTHQSPDGDTLGSGYGLCRALRKLGKKANVVCPDEISNKFAYLILENEDFIPETFVAVDLADTKLLGKLASVYADKIDLCIDHHYSNVKYAKRLYLGDNAAACECVFEVIEELGVKFDKDIANAIYTGIATDTGCFKFSNTSPNTHRVAAKMMEFGADYATINKVMFDTKTKGRLELERQVLENIKYYFGGKCAAIVVTKEMLEKTGVDPFELDSITAIPRTIEGVVAGITVKEKDDGVFKVSLRTYEPLDAAKICKKYGGGGHLAAAGCSFNCSPEEILQKLTEEIGKELL